MEPTIVLRYELALIILSLLSTGFLALLVFIATGALKRLEKTQEVQGAILITIAGMQEQIKTLFSHSEIQGEQLTHLERNVAPSKPMHRR